MTTRLMETSSSGEQHALPFSEDLCTPAALLSPDHSDILCRFSGLKKRIVEERNRLYGHRFEAQLSSGAPHDMKVGLDEYAIFNKVVKCSDNIFNDIDPDDWVSTMGFWNFFVKIPWSSFET